MKKLLGIFSGLVVFFAPIYAWIINFKGLGDAAWNFFKGGAVWAMILIGIAILAIGFGSLKD